MANTTLKLNHHNRAFHVVGLLLLFWLIKRGSAREFTVHWTVPNDSNSTSYNEWASANRFQIKDSLAFNYPAGKDSVLYVKEDAYANCNTAAPIKVFADGHTVFTFDHSGPYYFISGVKANCQKNEKLQVVVLADRSNNTGSPTVSPSPSPSALAPAPTPTSPPVSSPPFPSATAPAPSPTGKMNPSPAPESPPPPSAASSKLMSFSSSFGAFVGSYMLLASLT